MLIKDGKLLRIYISERKLYKRLPLYEWIVQQAREHNLAGATVLRGIEGFGISGHIHTNKILRLSMDLPIIIEIIDSLEKIEAFLPIISEAAKNCVVTLEDIHISKIRNLLNYKNL